MAATETSSARDVAGRAPGSLVELKGTRTTDAPLKGEFSERDCVDYHALVEREVERVERDNDGSTRTERVFETVTSTERHAPCRLDDASGSVLIDFTGAKVEAIEVHKRYEAGSALSIVGTLLNVSGATLGHRYTDGLPPATPVYVLGSVIAAGGVGASPTKGNPFIISHKSEEERTKSLTSTRLWLLVGIIVCFVLALALLGLGPGAVLRAAPRCRFCGRNEWDNRSTGIGAWSMRALIAVAGMGWAGWRAGRAVRRQRRKATPPWPKRSSLVSIMLLSGKPSSPMSSATRSRSCAPTVRATTAPAISPGIRP